MSREVTILLIDDDNIDAEAIERALRKHKIANPVVHARNGIEGLEVLRKPDGVRKPRLILLDLNMPRMNGLEFLEVLRDDPELRQEIVFVLTTSNLDEDRLAAYDSCVAGYVLKDRVGSNFTDLLAMIDSFWRVVEFPV